MLNKQKTREGLGGFAGSEMMFMAEQEDNTRFPLVPQGKCVRCPYFPGKGYACNLPVCPFPEPAPCLACVHFLPVNEHRRKARCVWTGERLDAGEEQRERECIGFERRDEGLTSGPLSGMVRLPKYNERHTANAIPVSPQEQEKAPEKALLKVLHIMPCRKSTRRERGYIGRVQRPVSVKTRQPLIGLGSVVPCLSFYPQNNEVPHV